MEPGLSQQISSELSSVNGQSTHKRKVVLFVARCCSEVLLVGILNTI